MPTPREKRPFLSGDGSWGYDMFCGWKQGLGWHEKLSEKGSVKQTVSEAKMKKDRPYIKTNNEVP